MNVVKKHYDVLERSNYVHVINQNDRLFTYLQMWILYISYAFADF